MDKLTGKRIDNVEQQEVFKRLNKMNKSVRVEDVFLGELRQITKYACSYDENEIREKMRDAAENGKAYILISTKRVYEEDLEKFSAGGFKVTRNEEPAEDMKSSSWKISWEI